MCLVECIKQKYIVKANIRGRYLKITTIEKTSKLIMKKSLRLIFFLIQNSKVREKIDTKLK